MTVSPFNSLRDQALATVDQTFAETIRHSPLGQDGRVDPSRSQQEISGILRSGQGHTTGPDGGNGGKFKTRLSAQPSSLHIDRARFPDLVVRTRDRVRAVDRPGQPVWEVLAVDDRSHTRLVLQLGEVG